MSIELGDDFFHSLLSINEEWCSQLIGEYYLKSDRRLTTRAYAIKFTGQKYVHSEWIKHITRSLKFFVYDKGKIKRMIEEGAEPYQEAMQAFGDTEPINDGKYGELILFLFVESVLKAPLMVHKVAHLMNRNDQAKGSDNLFIGNYKGNRTIFLGESKIKTRYSSALDEALDSINRFHQQNESASLDQEFIISRSFIRKDLTEAQLDYLYSILNPADPEHRNTNKAHPIFIMFNYNEIEGIEIECNCNTHGDDLLKEKLNKWMEAEVEKIHKKLEKYKELKGVELIFFLMPIKDVNEFRNSMYTTIHGTAYRKK